MNYKNTPLPETTLTSSKKDSEKDDTTEWIPSNFDLVVDVLKNLDNSKSPDHDLETIYIYLQRCKMNIDHILSNCNAVQTIINFLHSKNTDFLIHSLSTLYQLTLVSPFTVFVLSSEQYSPLFVELIENPNIIIQLSILLSSVLNRSDTPNRIAYFLCFKMNFIAKILEFLDHVSDGLQFSQLLQMVTKIFEKLTIEQANQNCFGIKLIKLPISMLQNSIISKDINVLIPVLQCFQVIIRNWEGSLQFCITDDVLIQIYSLLDNAHTFGDDGQILEELINFINVIIFGIIGKNEIGIIERFISGMYKQIAYLPEKTPKVLNTFAKIAYYEKTAAAFVNSEYFPKIFGVYKDLNFSAKLDYLIIFLNASYRLPQDVIDKCEDVKTYLSDAFEILSEAPEINMQKKISAFLNAVFKLFSTDRTLTEAFDCVEFGEFLNNCTNYFGDLEIIRVSQQIMQAFYSEEDEVDESGPFA